MGEMNIYKDIPLQMKIYGWAGNQTQNPCITNQVPYHWAIQANIYHNTNDQNNSFSHGNCNFGNEIQSRTIKCLMCKVDFSNLL